MRACWRRPSAALRPCKPSKSGFRTTANSCQPTRSSARRSMIPLPAPTTRAILNCKRKVAGPGLARPCLPQDFIGNLCCQLGQRVAGLCEEACLKMVSSLGTHEELKHLSREIPGHQNGDPAREGWTNLVGF